MISRHKLLLTSLILGVISGCSSTPVLNTSSISPGIQAQNSSSRHLSSRSYEGVRQGVIGLRKIRFDKWDANRDGLLTRDEVSYRNLTMPLGLIKGFKDYDDNNDGRIEFKEFLKDRVIEFWMDLYVSITEDEFFILDDNHDGQLTGFELEDVRQMFDRWPEFNGGDIDRDGKVSFSEFQDTYMKVPNDINLKSKHSVPNA